MGDQGFHAVEERLSKAREQAFCSAFDYAAEGVTFLDGVFQGLFLAGFVFVTAYF